MRRITILFLILLVFVLYYPVRYWLAQPPDPGALIVPTSLRDSFSTMERLERYTLEDWGEYHR